MSADNLICIQLRRGRWWVWMGFASDAKHVPAWCDAKFLHEKDAERYAEEWQENTFVEYGIVRMEEA